MASVVRSGPVPTSVAGEPAPAVDDALERRRELGQDLFDEVWEGVYLMSPGPSSAHAIVDSQLVVLLHPYATAAGLVGTGIFNLGEPNNYRVPDGAYHRGVPTGMYVPTAAIVVEIVSPGDRTWKKFSFYAAHDVSELLIADPDARTVRLFARRDAGDGYDEVAASALLDITADQLTEGITWP